MARFDLEPAWVGPVGCGGGSSGPRPGAFAYPGRVVGLERAWVSRWPWGRKLGGGMRPQLVAFGEDERVRRAAADPPRFLWIGSRSQCTCPGRQGRPLLFSPRN